MVQQSEQRPVDRLRGLRLHCWVLVLSGSRSVQENFFIDPLTGISYSTAAAALLGIESAWNNHNYYVNMQDCRSGCSVSSRVMSQCQLWGFSVLLKDNSTAEVQPATLWSLDKQSTSLANNYTTVLNRHRVKVYVCFCVCVQDMVYDLEDVNMWEPLLFGATSKKQLIREALHRKTDKMTQDVQVCAHVCLCVIV